MIESVNMNIIAIRITTAVQIQTSADGQVMNANICTSLHMDRHPAYKFVDSKPVIVPHAFNSTQSSR